jgi:DUF2075 family protein
MYEWYFYSSKSKTIFDLVWLEQGKEKEELIETFNSIPDAKEFQEKNNIKTVNSLDSFYKQQKNDLEIYWGETKKKENFAIILPTNKRPRYKNKKEV